MELLHILAVVVAFVVGIAAFAVLLTVWCLQLLWPILTALAIGFGVRRMLRTMILRQGDVAGRSGGLMRWTLRAAPLRPIERLWNAIVESAIETTGTFCVSLMALGVIVLLLAILSPASSIVLLAEKTVMLLRAGLDGIGPGMLVAFYLAACALGMLRRALRVKQLMDKVLTFLVATTSFTLFAANLAPSDADVQAAVVRKDLEQPEVAKRINLFADELLRQWITNANANTRASLKDAVVHREPYRESQRARTASYFADQIDVPMPTGPSDDRDNRASATTPSSEEERGATLPPRQESVARTTLTEVLAEILDLHDEGLHQTVKELLSNIKSVLVERIVDEWGRTLRATTLTLVLETTQIHPSPGAFERASPVRHAEQIVFPRFGSDRGPIMRIHGFANWIAPAVDFFKPCRRS